MDAANTDERRKYTRVGFTTRIEIRLAIDGQEMVLDASSKDLSRKGVFVRTKESFPLDTRCTVNVYLSGGIDEISLEIQGKVVRQADAGVGIVFESMDVDVYTHLKNIVRYNYDDN